MIVNLENLETRNVSETGMFNFLLFIVCFNTTLSSITTEIENDSEFEKLKKNWRKRNVLIIVVHCLLIIEKLLIIEHYEIKYCSEFRKLRMLVKHKCSNYFSFTFKREIP